MRDQEQKKAYMKEYREKNKEKAREQNKEWRENNKERNRCTKLQRDFGITQADFLEMSEKQGHVCAICKQPETSKKKKNLSVDHNHDTGVVRGLLCNGCNTALGLFKDDAANLAKAIFYLEENGSYA
tara:strand:+ start:1468 stop:1848 length:381 start_codon:yes stop_codon:yes gene_type:complete